MDKPFFRANIPLQSTLTIQVAGSGDADADAFVASGSLRLADLSVVNFDDEELRAGIPLRLDTSGIYDGHLEILFAREAVARVQMSILKPDGTKFVFNESTSRKVGLDVRSSPFPLSTTTSPRTRSIGPRTASPV